jgi:hypothetical protein
MPDSPPVRLDPFQTIVGVGWGKRGNLAILEFNSSWYADDITNTNNFLVDAQTLGSGLVHIFDNKASYRKVPGGPLLITSTVPFKQETVDVIPPSSSTKKYYHCLLSGPNASADQWYGEFTITNGGQTETSWVNVSYPSLTPQGPYFYTSLDDAVLNDRTVFTSYSIVGTEGPFSTSNPGRTIYAVIWNAILIFNLDAIRPNISNNILKIGFNSGDNPETADYNWIARVATFKNKQISDIVGDAQNSPTGWIADAVSSFQLTGQTANTRVDIDVNMTTLSVTAN